MTNYTALNLSDFQILLNKPTTIVLDVRHQNDYVKAHIPNSIFIGIDGLFEPWVELFIDNTKCTILVIAPLGREIETFEKLKKINYSNVSGYLKGSFQTWESANLNTDSITSIQATGLEKILSEKEISIFDVRKINEYNDGHLKNVLFSPLASLNKNIDKFNLTNKTTYIHCGGGYRSVIAASILKRNGIHNIIDIAGGMAAIRKTTIEIHQ